MNKIKNLENSSSESYVLTVNGFDTPIAYVQKVDLQTDAPKSSDSDSEKSSESV